MLIFSVELNTNNDLVNEQNTIDAVRYLQAKGFDPILVHGKYNGSEEISILVPDQALMEVSILADIYLQESILHIDASSLKDLEGSLADLVYNTGERIQIGRMRRASKPWNALNSASRIGSLVLEVA